MSYEYQIEHYGALPIAENELAKLLGVELLENIEFTVKFVNPTIVYFASTHSEYSRIAFAKTIEFILKISDSVVITEL